jgi:hypothetical protein
MRSYSVPSKDEVDEQKTTRVVLPGNEQYIAEIIEVEEIRKADYDGNMRDFLKVKFNVLTFRDGTPLEDINGDTITDGRWLWRDIDFGRVTFMRDGTPSLARQFFLSVMGIADMNAKVPNVTDEDMLGAKVILTVVVYQKRDGNQGNKITAISPVSRRGRAAQQAQPASEPKNEEPPAMSEEFQAAVADLVNLGDEDAA